MPPPGDPFAALAEPMPAPARDSDPFAQLAEPLPVARARASARRPGRFAQWLDGARPAISPDELAAGVREDRYLKSRPTSTAHADPNAVVATPEPGMAERAGAWARAIPAALNLGGAELERGLQPLIGKPWGDPQQDVDAAREWLGQTTAAEPMATHAAEVGAGFVPFALGPEVGATTMGSNAMQDATVAGASPMRALASGLTAATAGAVAPLAGRAVAPVARRIAAPIENSAGAVAGAAARGAVEGAPQGAVLGAGNAAALAHYDPEGAVEQLKAIPTSIAEMGALSALGHAVPPALAAGRRLALKPAEVLAVRGDGDPFAALAEPTPTARAASRPAAVEGMSPEAQGPNNLRVAGPPEQLTAQDAIDLARQRGAEDYTGAPSPDPRAVTAADLEAGGFAEAPSALREDPAAVAREQDRAARWLGDTSDPAALERELARAQPRRAIPQEPVHEEAVPPQEAAPVERRVEAPPPEEPAAPPVDAPRDRPAEQTSVPSPDEHVRGDLVDVLVNRKVLRGQVEKVHPGGQKLRIKTEDGKILPAVPAYRAVKVQERAPETAAESIPATPKASREAPARAEPAAPEPARSETANPQAPRQERIDAPEAAPREALRAELDRVAPGEGFAKLENNYGRSVVVGGKEHHILLRDSGNGDGAHVRVVARSPEGRDVSEHPTVAAALAHAKDLEAKLLDQERPPAPAKPAEAPAAARPAEAPKPTTGGLQDPAYLDSAHQKAKAERDTAEKAIAAARSAGDKKAERSARKSFDRANHRSQFLFEKMSPERQREVAGMPPEKPPSDLPPPRLSEGDGDAGSQDAPAPEGRPLPGKADGEAPKAVTVTKTGKAYEVRGPRGHLLVSIDHAGSERVARVHDMAGRGEQLHHTTSLKDALGWARNYVGAKGTRKIPWDGGEILHAAKVEESPETFDEPTTADAAKDPAQHVALAGLPPGVGEQAFAPVAALKGLAKKGLDLWSKPLVDVVDQQAGKVGKKIAYLARAASDRAKQLLGDLAPARAAALRASSGLHKESREAVRSLRRVDWTEVEGGAFGFARFQRTVEGKLDAEGSEKPVVNAYRGLVEKTGQMAEDAGMHIRGSDGEWRPFQKTPGGKRLMRTPTPELFELVANKDTPQYHLLVRALSQANGLAEDAVKLSLDALAERSVTKRAALEEARTLPEFPTHLRYRGQTIPLIHADPFGAIEGLTRSLPLRIAYVKAFGQGKADELLKEFADHGGKVADGENLLRALNGMPVDTPGSAVKPGSVEESGWRYLRAGFSLLKTGLLTNSWVPNLFEPIGKTRALAGSVRFARAYAAMAAHPLDLANETARQGARTVEVINWLASPGRTLEHLTKLASEVGLIVPKTVNEANEYHAAVAGMLMAKDLKAGRGTVFDRVRLEVMGFHPKQVERLMSGKATDDLYQALVTRMPEVTQGSTSLPAQRSRAANSRLYGHVVAFDSFAQMTMDRTLKVNDAVVNALKSGDVKRIGAAITVAGDYYFGAAASGMSATLMKALLVGGTVGLGITVAGALDEPADFLKQSLLYTLLGGPSEAIRRTADGKGGDKFYTPLADVVFPVSVAQDLWQWKNSTGRYHDQDSAEKAETFLTSHLPISGPVATLVAAVGLSSEDRGLQAAVRSYWSWREKHAPLPVQAQANPAATSKEHAEFRMHLRRAAEAMKAGKNPDDELRAAAGVDSKTALNVAQSLRSRRMLTPLKDDQKAALRKHLGATGYHKLEVYDSVLTEWADRIRAEEAEKPLKAKPAKGK